MVNKKYILLAGVCSALALQPALAQESTQASWSGRDMTYRGQSYDALDTAYIPGSRMEQQRRYLNHEYAFPSKPRNMWEIGINVGASNIFGDIPSKSFWNAPKLLNAMGFGATIRKALGYSTALRLQYNFLNASGYDYRGRAAANEAPWNNMAAYAGGNVYGNYKFTGHEATLQLVGAINNIKFHKAKNSVSLYGFVGAGALIWQTKISTMNASTGNAYQFAALDAEATASGRNDLYKDWLKESNEYDYLVTKSGTTGGGQTGMSIGDNTVSPVLVGGLGLQFKLGNRVSLTIEDKLTWTGLDQLDGVQMDPRGMSLSSDKDLLNYASIGLAFNIGNKNRSVLPLWWVNPLDHVYNELADPRHMKLPDPVLPDTDGDGVTDQFDKCPDTPQGVKVDSHGCPLDTDGDGVPDYKDKQLITPTECQPVDADGVGKCPCPGPECGVVGATSCNMGAGSVCFKSNSAMLSQDAKNQLANLSAQMKANPTCKVVVMGNAGSSKVQQQRSWDRVNAIIEYLSETQQISRDQFIFQYQGGTGDVNCVMYRSAMPGEEGPSNLPPPHPQLGTKK
jgi:OOP family OmpA-OmpF porin